MFIQYRIISKVYDLLDVFYFTQERYSPRKAVIENIPDKKLSVLELCTGTASNSILIGEKRPKAEVTGIDLSKEMLAIGNEKIHKKGLSNVTTQIMDGTKMTF